VPVLKKEQKIFVVQRLACFETVGQVQKDLREAFGIEVSHQQISNYDPKTINGQEMGADLKKTFEAARKSFLEDTASIPIANKAVRLRWLNDAAARAKDKGNAPLMAQLLEQGAKEMGDSYTNRQKVEVGGSLSVTLTDEQRAILGSAVDERY
jgi:hypothetical protein